MRPTHLFLSVTFMDDTRTTRWAPQSFGRLRHVGDALLRDGGSSCQWAGPAAEGPSAGLPREAGLCASASASASAS